MTRSFARVANSLLRVVVLTGVAVIGRSASAQGAGSERPLIPATESTATFTQPSGQAPQFIIKFAGVENYADRIKALRASVRSAGAGDFRQRLQNARATLDETLRGASRKRVGSVAQTLGVNLEWRRILGTGAAVVAFDPRTHGMTIESFLAKLRTLSGVESAQFDAYLRPNFVPNDPLYADQGHYFDALAGINAEAAWDRATGEGTIVAVIDTGYLPHADLAANIVGGYDFISDASAARDGDGRDSDATDEGDWTSSFFDCFTPPRGSSWHGTHVAGTVAAVTDNGDGVAGVAFNARVVPIRALGRCGGTLSDIADGIIWASGGSVPGIPDNEFPADVINMSLGGGGACDSTYQSAIDTAVSNGAVVVVAAGNSDDDANNARPANCNNVVTVAALDESGNRASFSNFGDRVDLAAPGTSVLSTLNTGAREAEEDAYAFSSGTSMAAPHVAGIAALLREADRTLTPAEIEAVLRDSSRPIPGTCSEGCGAGLADAAAAVNAVGNGGGSCSVINDFEDGDSGWTVSGGCRRGNFVVGTPSQRTSRGVVTQVGGDATNGTGMAAFTAFNETASNNDVDRGECVLTSPVWNVSGSSTVTASYFHGQRDAGDDSGDYFRLEISTDGGSSYAPMVSIGDVSMDAVWTEASTDVPAGSSVRVRVRVADGAATNDIIEAGLDDVLICN